jgi:cell division septation protein DedD
MRNNDTGEMELVLGNRHLLTGFFVVALLFGVAFAMGYVVGRNSAPSPKLQAETAAGGTVAAIPDARAVPGTSPSSPSTPAASGANPGVTGTAAAEDAAQHPAEPEPTTQAAKDGPAAGSDASAPSKTAGANDPAQSDAAAAQEPPPGTYWQVTAIAQPQAEVFAKVLRDKGFKVTLTPGTKNLTRVLVGPYPDRDALGRAKSDLESAGFHPVMKKE